MFVLLSEFLDRHLAVLVEFEVLEQLLGSDEAITRQVEVVREVFGTVVRVIRSAHHPLQGVAFLISIRMHHLAHKGRIAQ